MTLYYAIFQCVTAAVGTLGFCIVFGIEKKHLIAPAIGGGLCWGVYLLMMHLDLGIFLSTLIAAASVGIYGEMLSSMERVPGSIYFIPCCVPLIPGSNLYYAMTSLISNDWEMCRFHLIRLTIYAMGIALGLGVVAELLYILRQIVKAK